MTIYIIIEELLVGDEYEYNKTYAFTDETIRNLEYKRMMNNPEAKYGDVYSYTKDEVILE